MGSLIEIFPSAFLYVISIFQKIILAFYVNSILYEVLTCSIRIDARCDVFHAQ